jgi:hypothetical protein
MQERHGELYLRTRGCCLSVAAAKSGVGDVKRRWGCAAHCQQNSVEALYIQQAEISFTYDHRTMNTELPVRSAVLKHCTGGLVVRWVTTSESPLLYVFVFFLLLLLSVCLGVLFAKCAASCSEVGLYELRL